MSPRATIQATIAMLCAVVVALAASGCATSGSPLATFEPVARAADATSRSGGSQVAMMVTVEEPQLGSPVTITGGGAFNMAHHEGQLDLQLGGLPAAVLQQLGGGAPTLTELFKDDVIYISTPLFAGRLPNGARWMKLDLGKVGSGLGIDPQTLTSGQSDPFQLLQFLRGTAGSVHSAGREAVRGTQTTRYDGTLDVIKALQRAPLADRAKLRDALAKLPQMAGLRAVPFSVWIDDRHLVRRMTMKLALSAAGHTVEAELELEMFGYGATQAVNPPAASETYDATSLSLQSLSGLG